MKKSTDAALNLTLSGHTGKHIGFFHTGGNPIVRGWWEYKNGCEGGELIIDSKDGDLIDYDGCFELPSYIIEELTSLGIKVEA